MGSAFIKLSGRLVSGDAQSSSYEEDKTAFLRVSDIEEICDVVGGKRIISGIDEAEYEKNKADTDHYQKISRGNGKYGYRRYHDTVFITIGVSLQEDGSNSTIPKVLQMTLKDANASQVVKQIDNAIVDFEVRKAIAIKAGTEAKPK